MNRNLALLLTLAGSYGLTFGQTSDPVFTTSDDRLTFSADVGGNLPPEQTLVITSKDTALPFTIEKLPGDPGGSAPNWVTVTPSSGTTPIYVVVAVSPATLPTGRQTARIRIVPTRGGTAKEVLVTLSVQSAEPDLEISPKVLEFRGRAGGTEVVDQSILLRNAGGGGAISVSVSPLGQSPWLTGVTPSQTQTHPDNGVSIRVSVSAQGLAPGSYRDVIRITSAVGTEDVPVSFFVAPEGAVLGVDSLGVWAHGAAIAYSVHVLNLGSPGTKVNWTAELVTGSDWLSLANRTGTAEPGKPSPIRMPPLPIAATFPAGDRYALIRISDPNAVNSPQFVTAVLEVPRPGSAPVPDITPVGLVFTATERGPAPPAQKIEFFAGTQSIVPYIISATTKDGGRWLSSTPAAGTVTYQKPVDVLVSVNPAGLKPGVYTGDLNFTMNEIMRTANIRLVVRAASTAADGGRAAEACTGTRMYLTSSFTPNNFDSHAGWPVLLTTNATDECGDPVRGASLSASFSSGDASLALADNGDGSYSATWVPNSPTAKVKIAFVATHRQLGTAATEVGDGVDMALHGRIATNPYPIRSVARWGTVNTLAPVLAGPLAPGSVASIYGTNLTDAVVSATTVPLPTTLRGTRVRVGDIFAPLFFASPGQINFQIPSELTPGRQYPVTVVIAEASTIPEVISLVPAQPGVAATLSGNTIALHVNGTLVTQENPALRGEVVTIYLVGMGATNPAVKTGDPASTTALSPTNIAPTVTLAKVPVQVLFSGLTPGGVGLYQINLRVPADAQPGPLDLLVKQNDAASNFSQLIIGQ